MPFSTGETALGVGWYLCPSVDNCTLADRLGIGKHIHMCPCCATQCMHLNSICPNLIHHNMLQATAMLPSKLQQLLEAQ